MIGSRQKIISIGILVMTLAGLIYYAFDNWADFQQLTLSEPTYIAPLILLLILDYIVIGLITMTLTKPLGLSLGVFEAVAISIMTGFYNLVLPFRGGMVTRAVYLKTRHDFSYTNFLATLSASYVLIYLFASLLGLVSLLYTYTSKGIVSGVLFFTFMWIFALLLIVVIFSPTIKEIKYEWLNKFIRVINSWGLIKKDKGLIFTLSIYSLCQILLETWGIFLQFKVFGLDVPFIKCILLSSVGLLGLLIQITPAGIGVNEALILFSAQAIAITPAEALAATLSGRAVAFIVLIILGPISSYLLVKDVFPRNRNI
jgi:uncharacterized protein (TIRG00374 family)